MSDQALDSANSGSTSAHSPAPLAAARTLEATLDSPRPLLGVNLNDVTVAHRSRPDTAPTSDTLVGDGRSTLGDYDLLAEIARGGMGVVYKARHKRLNRVVALKVTRAGKYASPHEEQRFLAEAEAAAKLDHPHIVPIYEVGEAEQQQFFSMAYVEGESLAQATAAGPLPPRRAAELIAQVATAVAYAHAQGVIHRDLKPGNILLDRGGQARVTDFGLAKRNDADSSLTQAGQVIGTPSFMPPEQAEGKNEQVGQLADVYSLGATLYCLVTGRPPFQAAGVLETLKQVVEQEPLPPRVLNPVVDRDLDTIVLKCLQKRPEKRYASVTALAEDLERYLDHRHILARPVGEMEKLVRWCQRNPWVAGSLAGVIVVFLTAFVLVSWSYVRAENARQEEVRQRDLADEARDQARQREQAERLERYRASMIAASSALQLHNTSALRAALEAAPEEHRNWEWWNFFHQLDTAKHSQGTDSLTSQVRFSSDGSTVVLLSDPNRMHVWDVRNRREVETISGDRKYHKFDLSFDGKLLAYTLDDHTIGLWDLTAHRRRAILRGHEDVVTDPFFSADGRLLAAGSDDRTVIVWDTTTGETRQVLRGHETPVNSVWFSPDGRRLVSVGGSDRTARIWDLEQGITLAVLAGHEETVTAARFNFQGDRVLTLEYYPGNRVRLWDAQSGAQVAVLKGHTNQIGGFEFNADGSRIATISYDQTVRLWDGRSGEPIATLTGHVGWIRSLAFNHDGGRLVTGAQDQTVRLWDTADGAPLGVLHGHTADVSAVAFSSDGHEVISVSNDGNIRWWDARLAERSGVLRGHADFVYGTAFHSDGERVASASWDGTVRVWNATTGQQLAEFEYPQRTTVTSVALHPGGKLAAAIGREDVVLVWDLATGDEVRRLAVPTRNWRDSRLAFSPQGDLLASGDADNAVHVWDVGSWQEIAVLQGHTDFVRDVAFGPDGSWLASAGEDADRTVRIWDLAGQRELKTLTGHANSVYSLAVSRDGKWLASGGMDGTVRLWDTSSWQVSDVLNNGTNVYGLAFTPDGARLACACANNTIRLWDMATRKPVAELQGHASYVHQIAFSPDGSRLVSASGDKTLRIWDTLSAAERAAGDRGER